MAIWKVLKTESVWGDQKVGSVIHGWNNVGSVVAIIEMDEATTSDNEILERCAKFGFVKAPDPNEYIVKRDVIKTSWNATETQISIVERASMYPVGYIKCIND